MSARRSQQSIARVLWRRKAIIVGTVLGFALVAALVSSSSDKVYETSSTLIVHLAQLAANDLGADTSRDDVADAVSVDTVAGTQLLRITAEDPSPPRAKAFADALANAFVDYARRNLTEVTRARVQVADAAPLPDD